MKPKFQQMNEAVKEIRSKAQEAINNGQTFTREDVNTDQYEVCCAFSHLRMDTRFPNVSMMSDNNQVFTITKSDRSDRKKCNFKNYHGLKFKSKGFLITPVLARLCVLCQIINTNNCKEKKDTSRSVISDRNVYHEKLEYSRLD